MKINAAACQTEIKIIPTNCCQIVGEMQIKINAACVIKINAAYYEKQSKIYMKINAANKNQRCK